MGASLWFSAHILSRFKWITATNSACQPTRHPRPFSEIPAANGDGTLARQIEVVLAFAARDLLQISNWPWLKEAVADEAAVPAYRIS
jgi:hypothetical protein